jgi:tRNA (mo5U34)-methyltransferase
MSEKRFGDLKRWREALSSLPDIAPEAVSLNANRVGASGELPEHTRKELEGALRGLHPWRKGPFSLFGIDIDTEWRSDFKWARLADAITPLTGRRVLDVGMR